MSDVGDRRTRRRSRLPATRPSSTSGPDLPVAVKFLEDAVRALPALDVAIGGAGARAAPRPGASSPTPARAAAAAATEAEEPRRAGRAGARLRGSSPRGGKLRRAATRPGGRVRRAGDDWLEGLGAAGARAALGRAGDVLRKLDLGARVNEPLIAALVARLSCEDGAILIFVPGVREIDSLCAALERQPKCVVVPLHGRLSVAEQSRAFRPAPAGRTKVVVATDVAEASVTIPDCTNVIDCGLARSVVGEAWSARAARRVVTGRVSADAAKQRAGRAGRVARARAGGSGAPWSRTRWRPRGRRRWPRCRSRRGAAGESLFGGAVAPPACACPTPPP